ncbi:hypothetical protein HHK36_007233 [Tetracentron sinense]|uniref:RNA helicase n=1 Tax=Tetracentron sinense TaxID=13715 RepID=A0A835DPY4_TETSI|nr:hypothetical protein HHK36_007233 [Tetracentron sinense]
MVCIKSVERRERGWYDVIVLPAHECKWTFKEGDVAVLSSPRPGSGKSKKNNFGSSEDDVKPEVTGRVAGTVKRHTYKVDDDHILRNFHPKGIWYLTVLGSLVTTQREYIALHAFRHLNLQMQTAILQPSPEHFSKCEEQPPAKPECFTQNFVGYLNRTFNGPQLAAIQWAAMHTADGTSSGMTERQDPWLFTLVEGLQEQGKHTLILVCAPSNAATDELLSRVLDRGFIDGKMKVYRPDVARVGVGSQTRAAQAVSVERRTEQLLVKGREEIFGWLHMLKSHEAQFSQQIACLKRLLNVAAAAGRSQGSVGVDLDVHVARDHNRDSLLQSLAAVVEGRDKVLVEVSCLLILEGRFLAGSSFNLEEALANLQASFANEAEIVFTTQASEVAVLPALSLGAACCVLVGDPQHLPATVISKAAGTLLYNRSLFERFLQAGCPPYVFYDITNGRESHRGGSVSYQNIHEAHFCLRVYEHLRKTLKSLGVNKVSVRIITPYNLQLKCLQCEASNHSVGFVADIRRMNVALTRARRALWIIDNANALMKSEDWAALITDAKERKSGLGQRNLDMHPEYKSGTPSEDDEKLNTTLISRNGGYRPLKLPMENSLDELGEKS